MQRRVTCIMFMYDLCKSNSLFFIFQQNYLAQVTSNIWGTKFKIVGLAAFLPTNLGAGKKAAATTLLFWLVVTLLSFL